jgi:4-amino-4-deoxy-L-arabinose transferase-like glycosyltransferase
LPVSALLVPAIRADAGGALNLRRLQILVYWAEAPHTLALALLPVAMVCFVRALTTNAVKWKILAGVLAAAVVLSNAFGIVALGVALLCWLLAFRPQPWWKAPLTVAAIGVVSLCWTAP